MYKVKTILYVNYLSLSTSAVDFCVYLVEVQSYRGVEREVHEKSQSVEESAQHQVITAQEIQRHLGPETQAPRPHQLAPFNAQKLTCRNS